MFRTAALFDKKKADATQLYRVHSYFHLPPPLLCDFSIVGYRWRKRSSERPSQGEGGRVIHIERRKRKIWTGREIAREDRNTERKKREVESKRHRQIERRKEM